MKEWQTATVRPDLQELASTLADWADGQQVIGRLYLFGSRVRGDYRYDSDVDVAIEWAADLTPGMCAWGKENNEEFITIQSRLPGKLHIHIDTDDAARPAIIRAAENPSLVVRKVICVITPPRF